MWLKLFTQLPNPNKAPNSAANFFFLEKPFARSLLCAREIDGSCEWFIYRTALFARFNNQHQRFENLARSRFGFFLTFLETRAARKNSNILCWITKQLRENIREMKFWNFSRDSWLFTGMNVVSHFLFLAGIKVVKISFFFPASTWSSWVADWFGQRAPKISRRLPKHNEREKIISFKAAIVYWMIAWWLVNSRVLDSNSELETLFWWPGLEADGNLLILREIAISVRLLHAPLENHKS